MSLGNRIKELILQQGLSFRERKDTLHTTCPRCGRDDKLSILKRNGSTICYRGKCDFGRQWFEGWLSETARVPISEARKLMREEAVADDLTPFDLNDLLEINKIETISWPPDGTIGISGLVESDGSLYLQSRGIPPEVAEKYGVRYHTRERRVVFPIMMDGVCCGFQGRAIDKVDKAKKMRNNPGFRRDRTLMFWDLIPHGGNMVVVEGPVDAIKFDLAGGAVATMGKEISEEHIRLIMKKQPKTVYVGLDDDAALESEKLQGKILGAEVRVISVPDSCRIRCDANQMKADFGECTFEECRVAIEQAKKRDIWKINLPV